MRVEEQKKLASECREYQFTSTNRTNIRWHEWNHQEGIIVRAATENMTKIRHLSVLCIKASILCKLLLPVPGSRYQGV